MNLSKIDANITATKVDLVVTEILIRRDLITPNRRLVKFRPKIAMKCPEIPLRYYSETSLSIDSYTFVLFLGRDQLIHRFCASYNTPTMFLSPFPITDIHVSTESDGRGFDPSSGFRFYRFVNFGGTVVRVLSEMKI